MVVSFEAASESSKNGALYFIFLAGGKLMIIAYVY